MAAIIRHHPEAPVLRAESTDIHRMAWMLRSVAVLFGRWNCDRVARKGLGDSRRRF